MEYLEKANSRFGSIKDFFNSYYKKAMLAFDKAIAIDGYCYLAHYNKIHTLAALAQGEDYKDQIKKHARKVIHIIELVLARELLVTQSLSSMPNFKSTASANE